MLFTIFSLRNKRLFVRNYFTHETDDHIYGLRTESLFFSKLCEDLSLIKYDLHLWRKVTLDRAAILKDSHNNNEDKTLKTHFKRSDRKLCSQALHEAQRALADEFIAYDNINLYDHDENLIKTVSVIAVAKLLRLYQAVINCLINFGASLSCFVCKSKSLEIRHILRARASSFSLTKRVQDIKLLNNANLDDDTIVRVKTTIEKYDQNQEKLSKLSFLVEDESIFSFDTTTDYSQKN